MSILLQDKRRREEKSKRKILTIFIAKSQVILVYDQMNESREFSFNTFIQV